MSSGRSNSASAEAAVEDEVSLESTLESLTLLLKTRQKQLERRERLLDEAVAAFEREKSSFVGEAKPSDVLHLNVGGTLCAVLRRTLTSVEGSMLASRFSGRWDESLEKDRDGNYFIDQPIELFKPMIDYLRAKSCESPLAPPVKSPSIKDYEARQDFYRMVEFYGMTHGVYPTVVELHRGEPGKAVIVSNSPNLGVSANEWATFTLRVKGHNREVTSFEVVLGKVERAQIGWINDGKYVENLSNDPQNGVGEEQNSVALDCCRGGLLNQGDFIKIDGLTFADGSVVRCEHKGQRWLVDGKLVASSSASDECVHVPSLLQSEAGFRCAQTHSDIIPAFSGKGDLRILQIELSCP